MIAKTVHDLGATVTFQLVTDQPVSVVGDFNDWDALTHPLTPTNDGIAEATVLLLPGRFAFRYVDADGSFFDEPDADHIEPNGLGDTHSVLEVDAPVLCGKDDLERIEGIGPVIADALRSYGINTYAVLAAATDAALRQALGSARAEPHHVVEPGSAACQRRRRRVHGLGRQAQGRTRRKLTLGRQVEVVRVGRQAAVNRQRHTGDKARGG
jgi:hypothetical protein